MNQPSTSLLRRYVSSNLWSTIGRFSGVFGLLLVFAVLARVLPPAELGLYMVCHSATMFCGMLAMCGLGPVVILFVRAESESGATRRLRVGILRAIQLVIAMGFVVAVCIVVIALALGEHLAQGRMLPYMGWLVGWFMVSAIIQLVGEMFRGLQRFKWAAFIGGQSGGMLTNPLNALALLGLVRVCNISLPMVFSIQIAIMVILLASALTTLLRLFKDGASTEKDMPALPAEPSFSWLLRQSWPILVSQVLVTGMEYLDIIVVGSIGTEQDAALFGSARRLVMLVAVPLQLVNIGLGPFVVELAVKNRKRKLQSLLRVSATVAAIPALALFLLIISMPTTILNWTFGPQYAHAAMPLVILATGTIVQVISGSGGLALTMTGNQRLAMYNAFFPGLLYLAILPLMIQRFGIVGAAGCAATLTIVTNVSATLLAKGYVGVWAAPLLSPLGVSRELRRLRHRAATRSPSRDA